MTKENPTHENISALEAAIIAAIGQPKPHRPPNPQCNYFLPPTQRHVPHGSQVSKIRENGRARCRAFALDGDTLCINHSPSLCAQLIRAERVEASLLSRSQARRELESLCTNPGPMAVSRLAAAMMRKLAAGRISDSRADAFIRAARIVIQTSRLE